MFLLQFGVVQFDVWVALSLLCSCSLLCSSLFFGLVVFRSFCFDVALDVSFLFKVACGISFYTEWGGGCFWLS